MEIVKWPTIALLLWTIETLCCAIAYRIHRGQKGLGIPVGEWLRKSVIASLVFAAVGTVALALASAYDPGGHSSAIAVAYVAFIPFGAQVINWMFELDDWAAGVGIYFLRVLPAILVLMVVWMVR